MTNSEIELVGRLLRIGKATASSKNEMKAARNLETNGLVKLERRAGGGDGERLIVIPIDHEDRL